MKVLQIHQKCLNFAIKQPKEGKVVKDNLAQFQFSLAKSFLGPRLSLRPTRYQIELSIEIHLCGCMHLVRSKCFTTRLVDTQNVLV